MNLYFEQKRIEKAQKILELIEDAHRKIRRRSEMIKGYAEPFIELKHKYEHDIYILHCAVDRLEKYYRKTLKDVR